MEVNIPRTFVDENMTNQVAASAAFVSMLSLIDLLEYTDLLLRFIGMLIHIIYFYLVIRLKELRYRSLIYIHQVNFYGLIFMLHYMCYISSNIPSFGNNQLNSLLCEISEFIWASTKFLRSYSILLLALFRMLAVIKISWFNAWTKSARMIVASILIEYALSLTIVFGSKYLFGTTHGIYYCQDGFSNVFKKGLNYFTLTSSIGILAPNLLVIFIYIVTKRALNKKKTRLIITTGNNVSFSMSMNNIFKYRLKLKNQQESLTRQFLYINFFLVLSSLSFIIVNFGNLFNEFSSTWYHYRLITRIASLSFQTVIPIISLYGHPKLKKLFKAKNQPVFL